MRPQPTQPGFRLTQCGPVPVSETQQTSSRSQQTMPHCSPWYIEQVGACGSGRMRDPFGHEWLIGHEIEQLTPEEMQRRYDAMLAEG